MLSAAPSSSSSFSHSPICLSMAVNDIHVRDPVLANLRRIGVVRRKRHRGGIATGDLRDLALIAVAVGLFLEQTALVADRCVKDGKERLSFGAVFPMGLRAAFVPMALSSVLKL